MCGVQSARSDDIRRKTRKYLILFHQNQSIKLSFSEAPPPTDTVKDATLSVPAALQARSLLGQVTLMSDTMVVKALSGQRSVVGQGAELGYSFNASLGRFSLKERSLSVRRREVMHSHRWHHPLDGRSTNTCKQRSLSRIRVLC